MRLKLLCCKALQREMGFAMIVVSHDLGVINPLTDLTLVMKNGCLVEYGLILMLVALVVIGGLTLLGGNVATFFTKASNAF